MRYLIRVSGHIVSFVVVLVGLLGGGCASTRIIMTPKVAKTLVPGQHRTLYTVKRVSIGYTTPIAAPWKNADFERQFIGLAEGRYPDLFKQDPSAIPIAVRVDVTEEVDQALALGVYICTLCLVGGIFPSVPWSTEWQVKICAEDAGGAPFFTTGLQAEDRGWWTIFSPFGLMDCPGESDAPKVSKVFTAAPGMIPQEHRTYVVQCMVDLLVAELLKQDPNKLPTQAPVRAPVPAPLSVPASGTGDALPLPEANPLPMF